ncbi:DUF6880 family protein [Falsirhodobacter sp. 1013]|uniref:DUF6880 family protein n=1 Tax=Falsirhodobacter sp. 1013 TaxID=3417566 RepID=UPI003EBA98EA
MAAKALNKKNLSVLGTDRLAELLIEVTKGRADLQRRLRLELSAHQGTEDVTRDLRKRYASIRQAKGYLSRKTHRTFAKEIRSFVALIETVVAPTDPTLAFELLWELLHLAPGVLERTDDTAGHLAEAFGDVMEAVARLAPHLTLPPATLADLLFEALRHDAAGAFAGGIRALAGALGPEGLEHLKRRASAQPDKARPLPLGALLRDIADVQGDVDAYIAGFTAKQLTDSVVAAEVADRLLAANRAGDALALVERAMAAGRGAALDNAYVACLESLNRKGDLKDFLWNAFGRRPDADILRRYLRLLPDFDDIEAEDKARTLARTHADLNAAVQFFLDSRDPATAAFLVQARHDKLDADDPDLLIRAANALEGGHPLASVLLRRAVIVAALRRGKTGDDRRAADQLLACAAADAFIADYANVPDHLSFMVRLRRAHGRRRHFWAKVS